MEIFRKAIKAEVSQPVEIPERLILVHVGKTSGSTLMCELGFGKTGHHLCNTYRPAPSALGEVIVGRVHASPVFNYLKPIKKFDGFLITLRNPLDRFISYYFYEDPQVNRLLRKKACPMMLHRQSGKGCFDNLEQFALSIYEKNSTSTNKTCQELAWKVANGAKGCEIHNYFGYNYYRHVMNVLVSMANTAKLFPMYAIRTEFLARDWDELEQIFMELPKVNKTQVQQLQKNGTMRFEHSPKIREKSTNHQEQQRALSEEAKANLCRALCEEIQVYKELLQRSVNLNTYQVNQSMYLLSKSCPHETHSFLCSTPSYSMSYDYVEHIVKNISHNPEAVIPYKVLTLINQTLDWKLYSNMPNSDIDYFQIWRDNILHISQSLE